MVVGVSGTATGHTLVRPWTTVVMNVWPRGVGGMLNDLDYDLSEVILSDPLNLKPMGASIQAQYDLSGWPWPNSFAQGQLVWFGLACSARALPKRTGSL